MKNIIIPFLFFLASTGLFGQATIIDEGFESWPPQGWNIYAYGAGNGWIQSWQSPSVAAHSGSHSAYANINNSQCNSWLVSPPVIIASASYELSFWERFDYQQYYGNSTVYISTGSGIPTSGSYQVLYQNTDTSGTWIKRTISLNAYQGDTVHIAFRYTGTWHIWFMDDFLVGPSSFVDAELTSIINPVGVSTTPGVQNVVVNMSNNGTSTINNATIDWWINGVFQPYFSSSTLNLAPGANTNLTLGSYNFQNTGNYNIKAISYAAADFNPANDTAYGNYQVSTFKDGSMTGIKPEAFYPITGPGDVSIILKNIGGHPIDSIEVSWTVNGVSQPAFGTSGLGLNPGETDEITIGQYNFSSNTYEINATVNIIGDTNTANNSYISYAAVNILWESFEGKYFPPENWKLIFATRDDINFGVPPHGNYYYSTMPDANYFGTVVDTLFTPLLNITAGDSLHFLLEKSGFLAVNHHLIWINGSTGQVQTLQSFTTTPGSFQAVDIDISAAAGINYLGIVSQSSGPGLSKIDMITSDASIYLYSNDLGVKKESEKPKFKRMGIIETFDVVVKNWGTSTVNGSNYTVKLMQDPGIVLATANGATLSSWEEETITINHTFTAPGNPTLYFEIDYVSDSNTTNNTSRRSKVSIIPSACIEDSIGQPDYLDLNFPFTPNGNTMSLGEDDISQTIYLANEFSSSGIIYGFIYEYDNFLKNEDPQLMPLKVWISITNQSNLGGGWIPNNQLIMVFDDTVEILPGFNNSLYIPFNNPFPYAGQDNLVIQVYNYDPGWPPSIMRMKAKSMPNPGPTRTIAANDVFALDPVNPPSTFLQSRNFTFTTFLLEPVSDTCMLSGIVNDTNNQPLHGAIVSINGTNNSTLTDSNGYYKFNSLLYNTYSVSVSYLGYYDSTAVIILDTNVFTLGFQLIEKSILTISATVSGDNAPTVSLQDVKVMLGGYSLDSTTTDASGNFILNNVFADSEYFLTLSMYGYYDTTIPVTVLNSNINLGNIIMSQEFISPFDVYAENVGALSEIFWKDPLKSKKVKLQNDKNISTFSYTNSPNENVWLGNVFAISDTTTLTSIEIHTDVYILSVDTVTIDIFGAHQQLLASSLPFLIYHDSIMVIDIPNIVVYDTIYAMLHWKDNLESTNALSLDYSDNSIPNTAMIKYPNQPITLFSDFIGSITPYMSFHVRVNTMDDGNPITNNEILSYNIYRGMASEFPGTVNWNMLNTSPVTATSFPDNTWTPADSTGMYRYAVETIYTNGFSEYTFSDSLHWSATTSITDNPVNTTSINIFPVPARDFIVFDIESREKAAVSIDILNALGQTVDQVPMTYNQQFRIRRDVSSLPAGMYVVRIRINDEIINKIIIIDRD